MEEVSRLTQNTYSLLHNTTTHKHVVPPTKRLFKVAMLDPSPNLLVHEERLEIWDYQLCAIWKNLGYSEWSTPAGLKLARENLQSRVKEEDSIIDIENAIFDLRVMDSLYDMPLHIQAYTECIRWVFCKLYRRPRERHPVCPTKRHDFRLRSFQEFISNHDSIPQPAHLFVGDMRWRDDG
ncbi:hypothetical protein Tco_1016157 [Tanacetum coccineum]|uniref:Uncharacterized protein n=1 Tax=Tanacetum coccineum TaxID=301880 RepID=A0ABQ5FPQ4_9ASTR